MSQSRHCGNSPMEEALCESRFQPDDEWEDTVQPEGQVRLAARLHAAFEEEPFEAGMDHAADAIIEEALRSAADTRIFEWLWALCLDPVYSGISASVLCCLGRQAHPIPMAWGTELVRSALNMEDAEIRDAAVQAAEFWGGQDIRHGLKAHREPLPWLGKYIQGVVEDLEEA